MNQPHTKSPDDRQVLADVRHWLENFIIELNLCPFAKPQWQNDRVRLSPSTAESEQQLLVDLHDELNLLEANPEIETTLLIHPRCLQDFAEYNQFLDLADALIDELSLQGTYQIASFHPDYCFADQASDDLGNYTNRSPHPLLHILREQSLEKAIASHPDTRVIPRDNIELMEKLGLSAILARLSTGDQ